MSVRTSYRDPLPIFSRSPRQKRARKLRLRLNRIENMLTSGQHEAATLAARALIQRSPYDVTALTLTARCLVAGQDYNEALQLYDRILLQEDTDVVWLAGCRGAVSDG